jgi:antitoxin VapB
MKQTPLATSHDGTKSARLFRNGANQAVRIPREFELPGTEVTIRQVAGTLVIEPVQKLHPKGSVAALLAALATLESNTEPFPNIDQGLMPLDDISL